MWDGFFCRPLSWKFFELHVEIFLPIPQKKAVKLHSVTSWGSKLQALKHSVASGEFYMSIFSTETLSASTQGKSFCSPTYFKEMLIEGAGRPDGIFTTFLMTDIKILKYQGIFYDVVFCHMKAKQLLNTENGAYISSDLQLTISFI